MGVVSDEKLLELLELAMSSDTAETVKRAREFMDSGVDPIVLMSQLASLIMDIIAGSYTVIDDKPGDSICGGRSCKYNTCSNIDVILIFSLYLNFCADMVIILIAYRNMRCYLLQYPFSVNFE